MSGFEGPRGTATRRTRARWLAAFTAVAAACSPAPSHDGPPRYFGRPMSQTGLNNGLCGPRCACDGGSFEPTTWNDEKLARTRAWRLVETTFETSVDPYTQPVPELDGGVCGVVVVNAQDKTYRLQTFPDEARALDAGAKVTHVDPCGACSTLQDLTVYAKEVDLGRPVKDCGVKTLTEPFEKNVECLLKLGFTDACARVWAFNTRATRGHCWGECWTRLDAPYHLEDGGLNPCLGCDERRSGPTFKAAAGRTRRNTGIPSAICRPCDEVRPVLHDW